MKHVRCFVVAMLVIALMLLGARLVLAQPQPNEYLRGGGIIAGYILGVDMYDQLQPIVWATVYASDYRYTFVAYSSSGGFYEMFVPAGTYNVTVVEQGYKAYSNSVSVSDGSKSTINIYLEQSHVPIPEFPTAMISIIALVTVSACLAMARAKRNRKEDLQPVL